MGFGKDVKRGAGERVGHKITEAGTSLLGWGAKKAAIGTATLVTVFGSVTFVQTLASDKKGPSLGALYVDQAKENVGTLWDLVDGDDSTPNTPEPK